MTKVTKWMLILSIVALGIAEAGQAGADTSGCYAEDGSYIEDCAGYYSAPVYEENDAYLTMVWAKGTTDGCGYRTDSYSEANRIATQMQQQGYAAVVVHSTPSLDAKVTHCS